MWRFRTCLNAAWLFRMPIWWHSEYERGREEGVGKIGPRVIIPLPSRKGDGDRMVTVAAVTHSAPSIPEEAIEIPAGDQAPAWASMMPAPG